MKMTMFVMAVMMTACSHAAIPEDMAALMDPKVNPCDDFYQYSCGNWIKTHELKPSELRIDASFSEVGRRNEQIIQDILKEDHPLVRELWDSCMALDTITALGNKPLQKDLIRLAQAKNHAEAFELHGEFAQVGENAMVAFGIGPDPNDVTTNTVYTYNSELTLRNKEYYSVERFPQVEPEYRTYIDTLVALAEFPLMKEDHHRTAADIVIDIEKAIVKIQTQVQQEDERISIRDASNKWPIAFGAFSKGFGLVENSSLSPDYKILLFSATYFELIEKLINSISLFEFKVYLAFVMINSRVHWLGQEFIQASFQFYGKKINGQEEHVSRNTTCIIRQLQYFPQLMGKYYYEKTFDHARENEMKEMIELIEEAMGNHIDRLHWLDEKTKHAAKHKLDKVVNLIGQSNVRKHYDFELSRDNYAENCYTILLDAFHTKMRTAGERVNRMEWSISPAQVNAYYSALENKMVFPAAILQPPLFSPTVHPARNFGVIGTIIGHELTHGFDASGRLYDADGNKRDWWTNATTQEFNTRASCLKNQYSTFKVLGENGNVLGMVNGTMTIGENIADNGGVSLAWDAYRKYMEVARLRNDSISLEEADQIFFLAFGQNWCGKSRDQSLSQQLVSDLHSPAQWRANGVVMNNPEFARVFKCKPDAPMNPTKKCVLW